MSVMTTLDTRTSIIPAVPITLHLLTLKSRYFKEFHLPLRLSYWSLRNSLVCN